ncbi:MAG: heat-inducible transcriptional repressor [Candidatus Magasanikbacteria bacterium]|nr:heat-inducible transcriptional repressor [Candidatus Magasanikbacteria bacterium]
MDERKKAILRHVLKMHVLTGEPVGSEFLAETCGLGVSSATVRSELLALEDAGLLSHPHTSAGRVPTEAGYRFYVEEMMSPAVSEKAARSLRSSLRRSARLDTYKEMAKTLSELTDAAVMVGLDSSSFFYTGLSRLFQKPEFNDREFLSGVAEVIDRFDEIAEELFELAEATPRVLLGEDNPLGEMCGMVIVRIGSRRRAKVCGIFGPMRMDYDRAVGLLKVLSEI